MPRNSPYTFEICVDSPRAIKAATMADRIELCLGLEIGGLTPDHGLMEHAAAAGIETHVLIRGRGGDFEMHDDDLATACANIRAARALGLAGVVIGAERDGRLDRRAMETMIAAADGLDLTLHRVIDVVDDPIAAVEEAIALGMGRVLTSGGAPSAHAGIDGLNDLYAAADGRIEIMAGSGVNSANLADLMAATPITSFHASCTKKSAVGARHARLGFGESQRMFDKDEAQRIAAMLRGSPSQGPKT